MIHVMEYIFYIILVKLITYKLNQRKYITDVAFAFQRHTLLIVGNTSLYYYDYTIYDS
jgi:hypothetical protein